MGMTLILGFGGADALRQPANAINASLRTLDARDRPLAKAIYRRLAASTAAESIAAQARLNALLAHRRDRPA